MEPVKKRIVNVYNFVRELEPRNPAITPAVLLETISQQINVLKKHHLPATFALQYDALIDLRYQQLFKCELDGDYEIGAWWEIVQPLVEKAGLKWRGRFPWDWHANVGFSTGYTPEERKRLIDVYMADFRSIFGYYPKTVGSWFIDTYSLFYMSRKYHIVASCNCKDQVGTDGYTLWGGYWNQGYYPCRKNVYIPAQNVKSQIPVPVFRMLGSDPIYQYDNGLGTKQQGVVSLEPVYGCSGSNPQWVRWFFQFMTEEPCLAFAYAQAGQENSFTWDKMKDGFVFQMKYLSKLAAEGKITVETLAQTGEWFRSHFKTTPATAVVALKDWKKENRKTVWYNSKYYRINFLWNSDTFRVRDIHVFNQNFPDPYLKTALKSSACWYETLPFVDGFLWSKPPLIAGMQVEGIEEGMRRILKVDAPFVCEKGTSRLFITCAVKTGGTMVICCSEKNVSLEFKGMPANVKPVLSLKWSKGSKVPFLTCRKNKLLCCYKEFKYEISCHNARFEIHKKENELLIIPDEKKLLLNFNSQHKKN